MTGGAEFHHIYGEDAQTVGVAFFRVAAEQLLSDADAQYRLRQRADDFVQAVLAQVAHCLAGFSLSGKDNTVGRLQFVGIVGHLRLHAQTFQRMDNGVNVSGVVFDDGNFHFREVGIAACCYSPRIIR